MTAALQQLGDLPFCPDFSEIPWKLRFPRRKRSLGLVRRLEAELGFGVPKVAASSPAFDLRLARRHPFADGDSRGVARASMVG